MNIKTLGENLAELMNRINDEKGLSNAAKVAIIENIGQVIATQDACRKAMENLKASIAMHMDERTQALDAFLDEQAPQAEQQAAA